MSVQSNSTILQSTCAPGNGPVETNNKKSTADLAKLASVLTTLEKEVGQAKANVNAAANEADSTSNSPAVSADQPSETDAPPNFLFALMKAISKDQVSMSQMQITDALTTQLDVTIEQAMNKAWYAPMNPADPAAGGRLSKDALILQEDIANKASPTTIQSDQNQYNLDSTEAQANISQQEGPVQSGQGQTQTDASNLQNKVQMAQTVISINSTLTNLISSGIVG